jgi:hypothetical protein
MKKIVKLTESDLTNIIKRVIKESAAKDSLIDMVKYDGWESAAELVGGIENLKRLVGIETPMEFLHSFDDLDVVQSEEYPKWTLFRYKPKHNIMIFDRKNRIVHTDYHNIWSVLEDGFDLNKTEIYELTKEWLSKVYDLRNIRIQILWESQLGDFV